MSDSDNNDLVDSEDLVNPTPKKPEKKLTPTNTKSKSSPK